MFNAGRTLTRQRILDGLYTLSDGRDEKVVEVLVGRLLRMMGHEHVVTVRGMSYRIAS